MNTVAEHSTHNPQTEGSGPPPPLPPSETRGERRTEDEFQKILINSEKGLLKRPLESITCSSGPVSSNGNKCRKLKVFLLLPVCPKFLNLINKKLFKILKQSASFD